MKAGKSRFSLSSSTRTRGGLSVRLGPSNVTGGVASPKWNLTRYAGERSGLRELERESDEEGGVGLRSGRLSSGDDTLFLFGAWVSITSDLLVRVRPLEGSGSIGAHRARMGGSGCDFNMLGLTCS